MLQVALIERQNRPSCPSPKLGWQNCRIARNRNHVEAPRLTMGNYMPARHTTCTKYNDSHSQTSVV
jgi:hypothetical protein